MTDQTQNPFDLGAGSAPTDDEKLWSLLSYLTGGLIGLIMLLSDKGKQSQYIRHHAITSLGIAGLWFAVLILNLIVGAISYVVGCVFSILYLVPLAADIYYGIKAYQGEMVEVPYLSEFMRKQGWL